jgi:hypothetical protein
MPRRKRKPGAQPGNQNARKHGYYSKVITAEQEQIIKAISFPGINLEIALLRAKIRSIIEKDPENVEPLLRTLSSLCRAVRTRHDIASRQRREEIALSRLLTKISPHSTQGPVPDQSGVDSGGKSKVLLDAIRSLIHDQPGIIPPSDTSSSPSLCLRRAGQELAPYLLRESTTPNPENDLNLNRP